MNGSHLTIAILIAVIASCAPAPVTLPSRTPVATPTVTKPPPLPTPTPAPVEWVPLEDAGNLAQHPSWACEGGIIAQGRLELQAGGDYFTVANARGPYLAFADDWGLSATIEVASGEWGAFVLFGALPQGAWWKDIRRLDLSWNGDTLSAVYRDGTSQSPRFTETFAASSTSGPVRIQVRRIQDQLFFLVDGVPVGQMNDPGLCPDDRVYLGTNVPPNGRLIVHEIRVERPQAGSHLVQIENTFGADAYVPSSPSLRELAVARGMLIGAAVAPGPLRCELAYAQALAHEFNVLTTENAVKFAPVHPEPDRYAFDDADQIVDFAHAHDMQVRGHTLVWHNQLPSWVEDGNWTREELLEVLHDHIATVVGRYQGRVHIWDVVNEAIDKGGLRETIWQQVIGPDYLDLAFQWAHEADPEALLFYNDYGGEGMNAKSDAVYDLVKGMVERGVPIHGVGLQMHIASGQVPPSDKVLENMNRLADLGLQVHITELDVRIQGEVTASKLDQQAEDYGTVMETCLAARRCTAVIGWGFTDRYSWVPGAFAGWGSALIFDERYQPKPAYDALRDALSAP